LKWREERAFLGCDKIMKGGKAKMEDEFREELLKSLEYIEDRLTVISQALMLIALLKYGENKGDLSTDELEIVGELVWSLRLEFS
jgi:hypothetical protein